MTTIETLYKDWLYFLAFDDDNERESYSTLLDCLNCERYSPINIRDKNRVSDSIDFRYRFGDELGIPRQVIDNELSHKEVSVLELMITLSYYCYENVSQFSLNCQMSVSSWFKDMLESLSLQCFTNRNFDPFQVHKHIQDFLLNRIDPNGKGGLFTINDPRIDMRQCELWYQMNYYINEKINNF